MSFTGIRSERCGRLQRTSSRRPTGLRRSVGLWLAATVALAAWQVAGSTPTLAALCVALGISVAQRLLRGLTLRRFAPRWPRGQALSAPVAALCWALAIGFYVLAPWTHRFHVAHVLHRLGHVSVVTIGHAHIAAPWAAVIDLLVAGALLSSLSVARGLRRTETLSGESSQAALDRARAIVAVHGDDSLSPYILRPDKEFQFARGGDGVVAFAVVGETVVISGDPVGEPEPAAEALRALVERAHESGLRVAAYGASERYLDTFRQTGLCAVRAGEEAVVDPRTFTLQGRPVRKLRQSVQRLQRRGWQVAIREGREIDGELQAEIDAVEAGWRAEHERILGFAMSMGPFELEIRPDDLYVLAWSPEGRLQGVLRFLAHREKLSLDVIRRVGDLPNGLTEALVCHALEHARERRIEEVSLNYAGLAHLLRPDAPGGRFVKGLAPRLLGPLRSRFQMDRLVLFNQKFMPHWRPRYLVFESPAGLPRAVVRVLQAEGYLPRRVSTRRAGEQWSLPAPPAPRAAGRLGG
ncbi:MAG TPA: phosphatidylglycerol lysyltransferase domain-containing protein [Solirubrobacteraceae bacterium]|nr:phosphatidylglycerol lysyltransferase domain-containing protein [Solirubrobacteraceae bacterium]